MRDRRVRTVADVDDAINAISLFVCQPTDVVKGNSARCVGSQRRTNPPQGLALDTRKRIRLPEVGSACLSGERSPDSKVQTAIEGDRAGYRCAGPTPRCTSARTAARSVTEAPSRPMNDSPASGTRARWILSPSGQPPDVVKRMDLPERAIVNQWSPAPRETLVPNHPPSNVIQARLTLY